VLAAALAGLIYLPNLLWNVESGLVTFLHTGSNASLGGALLRPDKLFEFAASQFAVFGPILFAILVWRLVTLHRRWADPRERFLAWFVVTMLVPILALSFLTRANANWAAPIYVAGTIWVVATVFATGRRWPVVASVVLHLALAGVLYGGVLTATEPGTFAGMKLKPASSSFKRYRGWRKAAGAIDVIRAQHPGLPLLVDDRKTMAALLYYLRPWPVRAYAWHPGGRIGNHFALTRPWPARARGPALLVVRRRPPTYFLRHFRSAWPVATISVPIGIGTTRELRLFRVEGFLGYNSPPSARRPAKQAP
jgi:hypothetical protein